MAVAQSSHAGEGIDQRARNDQVSQAQGREKHLAESAQVNNPLLAVNSLERREWPTCVTIFAVIIILQDPSVGMIGPVQQSESTRHAHCDSEWVLVRGCNVGQADFALPAGD